MSQGVEIADGYARATGKVGVALTGTGPGATNTLTGIAGAFADNVPVLLLMGQHPLASFEGEAAPQHHPAILALREDGAIVEHAADFLADDAAAERG